MTLLKRLPLLARLACLALVIVAYFLIQSNQNQQFSDADSQVEKDSRLDQPQSTPNAPRTIRTRSEEEQGGSSVKQAGQVLREGGKLKHAVCEHCGENHRVHREVSESLRKSLSRSTSHLKEVQLEDGGIAIDLAGGFHHASSASVNAEGEVEIHCSSSIEEILIAPTVKNSSDRDNPPVVENTVR